MHKLNYFLQAQSIAVIGASDNPFKVGYQLFRNLVENNDLPPHAKKLYPVNPHLKSLLSHPVYTSIIDIPAQIDLVIIVTPAETVSGLIDQIVWRNKNITNFKPIKAVVIISAGFAEVSAAGRELQHHITKQLAAAHVALLGPNSLGLLSPHHYLNASFAQKKIPAGNIALISQSGAMLTALFDVIASSELGISFSVSLGNKADLNENDCIEFAATDPNTRVIALYLESFSNLPHFFELVSRISKKKPVVILKGGTSERGQAASMSHTAALATNQVLLAAAAQQMGFVLVSTIEELVNSVFFLAKHHYLIQNAMIITNAGGPAVNTIDRLAAEHVQLAQWSSLSTSDLERLIPELPVHNPFDLLGDASPIRYKFAIQVAQHDSGIDSILVIVTPQAVTDIPAITSQLIALKGKKPILVALMGGDHLDKYRQQLRAAGMMCANFPNDLVNILHFTSQITKYHFQRKFFIPSDIHRKKMLAATTAVPAGHLDFTNPATVQTSLSTIFALLTDHGFQVPEYHLITKSNFTDLRKLQYPLFAKTANLSILHKKDLGAIVGLVNSYSKAAKAFHTLKKFGDEVLFQQVISIDTELLLGIENDPQFGLYMTVGLGGSYANILADREYIFLPARKEELKAAWQATKAYQILKKAELTDQLVETMVKLQKLVMKNHWIRSIEINPLAINQDGAWVADIKVSGW